MRLFTGISLAPHVVERLAAVLDDLRPAARINWSAIENLHITLRFIGAWPDERLPELQDELARVAVAGPIPITIAGFGYFPNPYRPHSLFAGVQAGPELGKHPHVTLARIKGTHDLTALRQKIAAITDSDFGSFEVREFHLYSSQPTARGSVYTKLATYDLMREKNEI